MLEKIGHIKNPLTVIALFAGIAEVSGTIVLPLLEKEIQSTYVWFLMGFPVLLVGLFFITLWSCHQVLYAPSDFRDDSVFKDILAPGSRVQVEAKLDVEVDEALNTAAAANEPERHDATPPPDIAPDEMGHKTAEADASGVDNSLPTEWSTDKAKEFPSPAGARYSSVRGKIQASDVFAINHLEREFGVPFRRAVTLVNDPDFVFDGVAQYGDNIILAEVKFVQSTLTREAIRRIFERVERFYAQLPSNQHAKFLFIFALVNDGNWSLASRRNTRVRVNSVAAEYPFETIIREFSLPTSDA